MDHLKINLFLCRLYPPVSVASPMVPGGIRNIHEGKVAGQMANAANHHSDRHGTEDYMNIVHRLSNEVRLTKAGIHKQQSQGVE